MKTQVKNTVRASYHHLRNINHIRKCLDENACTNVINATVTSRQDYHNGLLAGAHRCVLQPLQKLQNHAARVLTRTPRRDHITPVLKELHWLPVKERADFKLLVTVHRSLHDQRAPAYIKEMFVRYVPTRPLRSSEDHWTLAVPNSRRHEGRRSCSNNGPRLWNELPSELREEKRSSVFKRSLKTFLFNKVYN